MLSKPLFLSLFASLLSILTTSDCLAENNFVGQMLATSPCELEPASVQIPENGGDICVARVVFLQGVLRLSGRQGVYKVRVGEFGAFSAQVPPGRYRISLASLSVEGVPTPPSQYQLAVGRVAVRNTASPVGLVVRHRTRTGTEGNIKIAY